MVKAKALDISIISVFTIAFTFAIGLWTAFPRGYDAYRWVSEVKYLIDYWPHCRWNYQWAAGMPFLLWYLPLPYYLVAVVSIISNVSIEMSLNLLSSLSYVLIGVGVYGFVLEAIGGRRPALAASFLTLSTPAIWVSWELEGVYAMTISTGFMPLTLWALLRYLHCRTKGHLLAAIISLTITLQSQLLLAAITIFAATVIILLYEESVKLKLSTMVRLFIPSFLMSAYFYLQFLSTRPMEHYGLVSYNDQIWEHILSPWWNLFLSIERNIGCRLSPLILPLFAFLIIKDHARITMDKPVMRIAQALGIVSFLLFTYTIIPTGQHISGFEPSNSLHFLSIFLAMLFGLLLGQTSFSRANVSLFLICLIVLLSFIYFPIHYPFGYYQANRGNEWIRQLIGGNENEIMYRFGIPLDDRLISQWFNYQYEVPQTRHWYFQGVIGDKWLYWLYHVTWRTQESYEETRNALNWYAVKWFITLPYFSPDGAICNSHEKFLTEPDHYEHIFQSGDLHGFIYREASSIVSASNKPTVLIIGTTDNVFRALVISNGSGVVPIWGHEYIDDHSSEELAKFDAIALYGYSYHNKADAWGLLETYVKNGGGLFVESSFSQDSGLSMLSPCPVEETTITDFGEDWSFTSASSPVTNGVDFTSFSPALYDDRPWKVSASYNESVRTGVQTVLWINGRPLISMGEYGEGRVVWSGINLPYHVVRYRNRRESLFLSKILEWASGTTMEVYDIDCEVRRPHPEKITLTIRERVKGILFKENFFKNWHAFYVRENSKHDLEIYRAGPDLMYIQLPRNVILPVKVFLEYGWTITEIAGYIISAVTLIVLAFYTAGLPLNKLASTLLSKFARRRSF